VIDDEQNYLTSLLHVGQIAAYLLFDERMRQSGTVHHRQAMPLGYLEFAAVWNEGALTGDPRRLSTFFLPEGAEGYTINLSTVPIPIADFDITPEQIGLSPDPVFAPPRAPRYDPPRDKTPTNRAQNSGGYNKRDQRQTNRQGYQKRVEKRQRQEEPEPIRPNEPSAISNLNRLQLPKEAVGSVPPPVFTSEAPPQNPSPNGIVDQDATMKEISSTGQPADETTA
jgi:hypothetical protein